MFDEKKLKELSVNGIFDKKGEATGEGYKQYLAWRDLLVIFVEAIEEKYEYSSRIETDSEEYRIALDYANVHPEMAVDALTSLLLSGASWYKLSLIYDITGFRNNREHAGMFYSQVGNWLLNYDDLRRGD